jgi:fluoroquinolone transport system permease protein
LSGQPFAAVLRWDVTLQARNGFYWASAFVVLVVGTLLLLVPEPARANGAAWVPALVAVNLQVTTFFFVSGLFLLEREEGTLLALAVSPVGASVYLLARMLTLSALATVETLALVWLAFPAPNSWPHLLGGTVALAALYTALGTVLVSRYESVNAFLLPASALVTMLLIPLLGHFALAPASFFLWHPLEPALTLLRAGYDLGSGREIFYGAVGSCAWAGIAFAWAQRRLGGLMRDTRARGGR